MEQVKIINFPQPQEPKPQTRKTNWLNTGKAGRVYCPGGNLWVDFRYLGERVREPAGLDDNPSNRVQLRKMLDLIVSEIGAGIFEFGKRFPHSKRREHFTRLEGRNFRKDPNGILFGDYVEKWWTEMRPGMSESQIRDYASILKTHLLAYFGDLTFAEFRPVLMKKFLAHLHSTKAPRGNLLSPKRIHNIFIPMRVIFKDAIGEYGWGDFPDPFVGLKLPRVKRIRIYPFTIEEWL